MGMRMFMTEGVVVRFELVVFEDTHGRGNLPIFIDDTRLGDKAWT